MTCAGGVVVSTASIQGTGHGPNPTSALYCLAVRPIPFTVARELIERNHYLHSLPGGTMLCFGIFSDERLLGAVTLGAGPYQAYHLVDGAARGDCLVLTRMWLSDESAFKFRITGNRHRHQADQAPYRCEISDFVC